MRILLTLSLSRVHVDEMPIIIAYDAADYICRGNLNRKIKGMRMPF